MFTSIFSRSTIARLAIAGMVLAAVTVSGPTASADSGPVSAQSYSYTRTAVGNTVLFRPGEEGQVSSNAYVSDEYSGWPVANNTVFTRTAFSLKNPPAALLPDYPLEVQRYWYGSNWNDEECSGLDDDGNTLTINSTTNCINSLSITDSYSLTNGSNSNQTVNTNFSSQVVKVGKKGKKAKAIAESNGLTTSLSGYFYLYNEDSVTLATADGDRDLSATFEMCIDESLVDEGDILDVEYDFTHTVPGVTSDVPSSEYLINEGSGSEYGTWDMGVETELTFQITDKPDENLVLGFYLYLQDDEYADTTESGTYEGTVDVKRGDGTSVTEPCPTYDQEAAFPTSLTEVNGVAGSAELTTTSRTTPTVLESNPNFDQYSSWSDGFGGMFYWAYPGETWEDNPNRDVKVVHMTASAPSNLLAGIGQIAINTGKYGYFEIARYGADGQNYVTLVPGNKGAYAFTSGSMTVSSGQQTASFTAKTLNGLCGRGFTAGYVAPVSAATVSPLLQVWCYNGAIGKSVLAKVVSGVASVVATLGTGTKSRPCVVSTYGTDTRASGSEAAVVVYTRVSSKDSDGNCGTNGATISKRSINTVPADLLVIPSATNLTSKPWTGHDEPGFINIAAGTTPGTWFGISSDLIDPSYSSESSPVQLFSMTGSAITIEGDDIALDETTDFGMWTTVTPLAQESPTEWSLMITGSAEFDGEGIGLATVATINTETGFVTNGDILQMRGMGNRSSRIIANFSSDSDGNATMYTVTSADTYKASVWDFIPE